MGRWNKHCQASLAQVKKSCRKAASTDRYSTLVNWSAATPWPRGFQAARPTDGASLKETQANRRAATFEEAHVVSRICRLKAERISCPYRSMLQSLRILNLALL